MCEPGGEVRGAAAIDDEPTSARRRRRGRRRARRAPQVEDEELGALPGASPASACDVIESSQLRRSGPETVTTVREARASARPRRGRPVPARETEVAERVTVEDGPRQVPRTDRSSPHAHSARARRRGGVRGQRPTESGDVPRPEQVRVQRSRTCVSPRHTASRSRDARPHPSRDRCAAAHLAEVQLADPVEVHDRDLEVEAALGVAGASTSSRRARTVPRRDHAAAARGRDRCLRRGARDASTRSPRRGGACGILPAPSPSSHALAA